MQVEGRGFDGVVGTVLLYCNVHLWFESRLVMRAAHDDFPQFGSPNSVPLGRRLVIAEFILLYIFP